MYWLVFFLAPCVKSAYFQREY